ncbi:hypothetical protein N7494_005381 [Penicillium frequentans]|uniref:Uncharacterized protein n=1 Tax=Penicillium frequentans TaxID=3151616 RepID=A0AAD6CY41_9EURO|nr:hypothetical protein N7494_005381 [Penicillium glabrum]
MLISLDSISQTLAITQTADVVDDSPPPYPTGDRNTPSTGDEATPPLIPGGHWDLACSIHVQGGLLQLSATGEPEWLQDTPFTASGNRAYRRDGFTITLDLPQVSVRNQVHIWTCDANTDAGRLLISERNTVILRGSRERLFVFERSSMTANQNRPLSIPRGSSECCLKIETQSPNIWTISGTDIYQVEICENDVVVRSTGFLRLWNMAEGRFLWEQRAVPGSVWIWGFIDKYILVKRGNCHLYERRSGNDHGQFDLPCHQAFIDWNESHHFGPVMSAGGLFLYKPCQKAIFIFEIRDRAVDFRIWKSTDDIRGSLVLRGNIENLELDLLGQKPQWTNYEETERLHKNDFINKSLLHGNRRLGPKWYDLPGRKRV